MPSISWHPARAYNPFGTGGERDGGGVSFEDTNHFFGRAMDVGQNIESLLHAANRSISIKIPLELDDGAIRVFTGYRVQHNNARGTYKGGLRYAPDVDLGEVRSLASLMTWKTALTRLLYGGAKGGIAVDVRELGRGELELLTRRFVNRIHDFIGPQMDILANAGGVVVSYFEWVQNLQSFSWKEKQANAGLHSTIAEAYRRVRKLAKRRDLDLRTAAFVLALGSVGKAAVLRGIY